LKANEPLIIDLRKTIKIDRALFQENISTGQRVEEALLEYWDGKEWNTIQSFTTIGYKRLLRFKEVEALKFRFTILRSKATVQLAEIGFFKASKNE
jgi:alpha-L-fucosidase